MRDLRTGRALIKATQAVNRGFASVMKKGFQNLWKAFLQGGPQPLQVVVRINGSWVEAEATK
ncbi:MAG: hypothetical protein ABI818_07335 [Acidobacteriota bacterium]